MNREDFLTVEREAGIATLWIDHQLEAQNIVSPAVIPILDEVFAELENDDAVRAIVIISRKENFIAGADIKAFAIEKEGDFRPYQEQGHEALARLAASKKPVIAAIHGACLGLGAELALACQARIASDDPSTRLGFPEIRLGLLPGAGGTQRLPRRIGIQRALDMMLTGRNIYAYQARKIGLVDELTHRSKLHHAARVMAHRLLEKPIVRKNSKSLMSRLLEDNPIGRSILFGQARKQAYKQSQGLYPAVPALIECVETGYREGEKAGYACEREHFEKLMLSPESVAMRALFFAMTDAKKNPFPEPVNPVQSLGIVGAGFMGAGIAEVSVTKGFDVTLKDINEEVLANARKQLWEALQKKLNYRSISQIEAEETMGRLTGQLTYDHFEYADLTLEAVVEKMELKKRIIDDIQATGREDVIIASNTSSLSITAMAEHASRPERVVGMHYFSPVPKMPLLEIVRTKYTADSVLAACHDVGVRQDKTCIIVKDSPGFYVNRILAPYMNEALTLLEEGIGMVAIDTAMKKRGFPVGPIQLYDQVGLDIAAHVVDSSRQILEGREGFAVSNKVIEMFEAGRLGRKNRKGFYRYHPQTGKRQGPDETAYVFFKGQGNKSLPLQTIQGRLLMLMINEAIRCLEEGIIQSPTDGDLGAVLGIGFLPFTGGPFRYVDRTGPAAMLATMERLATEYGPRFRPTPLLVEKAGASESFYADA